MNYLDNYKDKLYAETKELVNIHNGNIIHATFRPFRPGDEEGIISCIREEYGESYFKRDFYDEKFLRENAMGDHYVFFVSEVDGEIVAMEIFSFFTPQEYMIEPATQIIHKEYRGCQMAEELVKYTFKIARSMNPSCLFVHAVTFHAITQHVVGKEGLIPVGFRFGRFLTSTMHNGYRLGNCEKYSEGIMIQAVGKKDVGNIYLPKELCKLSESIYKKLSVGYNIVETASDINCLDDKSDEKDIVIYEDEIQKFLEIRIYHFAKDTIERLKSIIAEHSSLHFTFQIISSISDREFAYCYEGLKKLGFFFSGLRPLCSDKECIYMQNIGKTKLHLDEYKLTKDFRELADNIKIFMGEENV